MRLIDLLRIVGVTSRVTHPHLLNTQPSYLAMLKCIDFVIGCLDLNFISFISSNLVA